MGAGRYQPESRRIKSNSLLFCRLGDFLSSTLSLARVHTITAALLGASLAAIALDLFAVRSGRAAYTGDAFLAHTPFVAFLAVLLAGHLGLSIWLARRSEGPRYRSPSFGRLQYGFLGASLGFLVVHLVHTWSGRAFGSVGFYDALMRDLGVPFYAIVYVLGTTAACAALAVGGDVFGDRAGFFTEPRQRTIVRAMAIMLAVAIWIALFVETSHFVVGRALLFAPEAS
jgi:hypothetical protein